MDYVAQGTTWSLNGGLISLSPAFHRYHRHSLILGRKEWELNRDPDPTIVESSDSLITFTE